MKINYWKLGIAILAAAYFFYYALNTGVWHYLDGANLIIHEAGHIVFMPFGQVVGVMGGGLLQVLIPLIFAGYFFLVGQKFSGALVLFWVGQNIINVSVYAGDARAMALPLLGGESSIHDWHFLLNGFGLLTQTKMISSVVYFCGLAIIIIAAGLSVCFSLAVKKKETDFIV
jgi:hypothetical protein